MVKEEVWSEAKKLIRLVREAKNTRLILHSLRPYSASFKTDCEKKKTVLQTIAGHTHLFLCGFKNGRK